MELDFHTHNLKAAPGTAIVNLPEEALLNPSDFEVVPGLSYSAGIHPWWTPGNLEQMWKGFRFWTHHPQVVAVGECGLDKLKGLPLLQQEEIFLRQVQEAEQLGLPVTVHCVHVFDRLLYWHQKMRPQVRWTVHGFRGKPELAQQLLAAGFDLSFGSHYHSESLALTPPDRCHFESDDDETFIWDERR